MEKMKKIVTGLNEVEKERNVAWILDLACRNESIARGVEKLWTVRFVQKLGLTWHTYQVSSITSHSLRPTCL